MSCFHSFSLIISIFLLFNRVFGGGIFSKHHDPIPIEIKYHTDIRTFYEPLIEFNPKICQPSIDGLSCQVKDPVNGKEVKMEYDKTKIYYILDGINHTIRRKDFFKRYPDNNCEKLTKMKEKMYHGEFLVKEVDGFCAYFECRHEKPEKIRLCMDDILSEKERKATKYKESGKRNLACLRH